jgi:hypothetical protein
MSVNMIIDCDMDADYVMMDAEKIVYCEDEDIVMCDDIIMCDVKIQEYIASHDVIVTSPIIVVTNPIIVVL